MIRIDEIYNNTFWPYITKNIDLTRIFFCWPPGRSDPESLLNHGNSFQELNYIFFHDQEPIHLETHRSLFVNVVNRNANINFGRGTHHQAIITSESNSEMVEQVCSQYRWTPYYYFFHGWAALDWYRGYDKTFLITPPKFRTIQKTFIAPNRIIAGKRRHRLAMLYHIFKLGLLDNHISCPVTCPAENISVYDAVKNLENQYHDIVEVFAKQSLPLQFADETDHPMHSCWLSLFEQAEESLLYLVTETVATGRRHHLTEKTFKPIAHGMPFILVSTAGSLRYLRSYGFKTFGEFWDESYDDEVDDIKRIEKISLVLRQLDSLAPKHKNSIFHNAREVIEHNWNHFYNGGFEKVLWHELNSMLTTISQDFKS